MAQLVREEIDKRQALAAAAPELISVAEYARRRSISISTVRAAIRERRLDATRFGRTGRAVRIAADAAIRAADAEIAEATEVARRKLLRARR